MLIYEYLRNKNATNNANNNAKNNNDDDNDDNDDNDNHDNINNNDNYDNINNNDNNDNHTLYVRFRTEPKLVYMLLDSYLMLNTVQGFVILYHIYLHDI